MDGFRQSTDIGGSHRSTGHLVTWSPPIRLCTGVLVYETLGITISLEGLGHQLLFLDTTHSQQRVSAHQCPHHSLFVGCTVVGVKAQILIYMGGLVVHRGTDVAIFFSAQEDVKEGELPVQLLPHCELYADVNTVQMVMKGVNQVSAVSQCSQGGITCIQLARRAVFISSSSSATGAVDTG